jgi:hypothetical protein
MELDVIFTQNVKHATVTVESSRQVERLIVSPEAYNTIAAAQNATDNTYVIRTLRYFKMAARHCV